MGAQLSPLHSDSASAVAHAGARKERRLHEAPLRPGVQTLGSERGTMITEERAIADTCPPISERRRMSGLLRSLASDWPGERLTLGDLEGALGDRSFGVLLLALCIPALVPGVATVATVPLV